MNFQEYLQEEGHVQLKQIPYYLKWVDIFKQHNEDHTRFLAFMKKSFQDWQVSQGLTAVQMYRSVEEYGDRITPKMITGIWARKDIMDQFGILPTDFQTQEGFIEALKKVKNSGINYNGQELIPAIIGENGGIGDTFEYVLPNMFAILLEDENGDLIDWRAHPKALEMVRALPTLPYAKFTNAFAGIEPDGGTPERAQYERINDYWEEELVKMLITPKTDADVEKMWNATLKRMQELGSEDILAIENEKFKANKNKLNISRAWPEEIPES